MAVDKGVDNRADTKTTSRFGDATTGGSLPRVVTSAPTLTVFRNRLKTYLFSDHFPHNCCLHLVLYTAHIVI